MKNLNYHLMPKNGWLNDPNGLVFFNNRYHIFYQADPDSLNGSVNKSWGHYTTQDFITYEFHGMAIHPDAPFDRNGAYSGSAVVKDGVLYLFYTGNVKHEGNHDYIHSGREHNLVRVESRDGIHFENKICLLTNDDYPADCTNHVRDPKVFVKDGKYHLVLGARLNDDTSCVLEYVSGDLNTWSFLERYTPKNDVGFMIECPDYLHNQGQRYIVCSPQGLPKNQEEFQNVYDCGYYQVDGLDLVDYKTIDYGFDFYAPQTFYGLDQMVMIAWIGMPDNRYIDICDGWNQTLTIPRKITFENGSIVQQPIDEILSLRLEKKVFDQSCIISKSSNIDFDVTGAFTLRLNDVVMEYRSNSFKLDLTKCNCGRSFRYIKDVEINKVSVFVDESVLEIFINDGRYTLTSRFYDQKDSLNINFEGIGQIETYEMKGFKII